MPAIRSWSILQLDSMYPTGLAELYSPSHFLHWRQGQTAVDLILANNLHDLPRFLPYAYYPLATADWSSRKKTQELGMLRLSLDQMVMLGVGRALQQERLGEALTHQERNFVGFVDEKPTCQSPECNHGTSVTPMWTQPAGMMWRYRKHADLIEWIKDAKEALEGGEWGFCGSCSPCFADQADRQIKAIFDGFCKVMEIAK